MFYSALICTDRRWSVLLRLNLYWSVLICSVRCQCVLPVFIGTVSIWSVLFGIDMFFQYLSALFGFDPYCSVSMCSIQFCSVLCDVDLFYSVLICTVRFISVLLDVNAFLSELLGVDGFYSFFNCTVQHCFIWFWSVVFGSDVFYSVLFCTV